MTAVCAICGDAVDDDEEYDHGHFGGDDEDDDDVEIVHLLISGVRKDKLACGADAENNPSATNGPEVNCAACRAVM